MKKNTIVIVVVVALEAAVQGKSPTTRPSVPCCQRRAESKPAQATSKPATSRPVQVATRPSAPMVTVYYFHRTMRCPTCRRLEELARQAVEKGFAHELDLGIVKWQTINVEQEGYGHFVKDFKLEGPSLVMVKTEDGKRIEWQNLEKIWELVRSPDEYIKYVQDGLRGYLHEGQHNKTRKEPERPGR